ncbi:Protein-tyrosine-phosphatase protein [Dioscorea alata]|uniref:Protein-tyrosine-phosphatase protein n=1 Tax=Dioscorea alata TaxID=55571 RepID=A0ACB7URS2_DIOAL|nr:Protein-tyrosine-phosphatase protein [Dioscorea alata]
MGLSFFIGLKATVLFIAFILIREFGWAIIHIPLLHASLVAYLVAIASLPSVNLPLLLGKGSDGSFPLWSLLIFSPFLVFVRMVVFVRRMRSREPLYSELSEGLFVGGWPSSLNKMPPGDPAVIDCTCELPRRSISGSGYLCIATWDTRSPQASQIESAVRWACRKRSQKKPVYVHCAFGHGRSVCVMCAILVALGIAEDWKHAEKIIKEKRPFIRMNALHRKNLEEWSKHRLSSKRSGDLDVSSVILSETNKEK